ncbi:MAG: leucine-rich repeat domain-containing protein [Clostridia bacterium]|nr:leucine-rich repeat domain-containing protein [Clostridia bacterium]
MKRVIFVLILLMLCVVCTAAQAEKDGLYIYEINEDNTVTITGYDWANNHGDIYIPEMLGNRLVSAIGDNAFATRDNEPVSITLPDGIRSIGELAFRGVAIKYINIPLNTTVIGGGAFAECSVMQFRVASGHQVFATIENALYNKQTKTLIAWPTNKEISEIPNGIVEIGDYVFYGRNIDLTYRVTVVDIESKPFIPDSLTTIGRYAFAEGSFEGSLNNVSVIKDYAFFTVKENRNHFNHNSYYMESKILITSQLHLSIIGSHAFENQNVILYPPEYKKDDWYCMLSDTPYEIGEYAFHNTYFPSYQTKHCRLSLMNLTSIGKYAFAIDIENIRIVPGNEYTIEPKTVEIQEGDFRSLRFIGECAFGERIPWISYVILDCRELKSVGTSAFECNYHNHFDDDGVKSVTIGSSVTIIADKAFKGCELLESLTLSEGLETIGSEAFMNCKKLAEISIPASVTYIGNNVFDNCSDKLVITVEAGSYGEIWARTCGYAYKVNGQEDDTSWLTN